MFNERIKGFKYVLLKIILSTKAVSYLKTPLPAPASHSHLGLLQHLSNTWLPSSGNKCIDIYFATDFLNWQAGLGSWHQALDTF